MSITIDPLNLVNVLDPRVDVHARSRREYGVLTSGNENTWKPFPSVNFNNNSVSWSVNPPNKKIMVNRRVYMRQDWTITFTGQSAAPGIALLQATGIPTATGVSAGTQYLDAPRCQPLSQVIQSMKVIINNGTLSSNIGSYFRGLTRYKNKVFNQDVDMSMTATMPDQSQMYSDLQGFARDPLRGYGDNPQQCPRGGFVGATILQNDTSGAPGAIAIVQLSCVEPVYLSPFLFGESEENQAFVGVETMDVQCQLGGRGTTGLGIGALGSLWSHSTANTSVLTNATATLTNAVLYFNYITPDMGTELPRSMNYALYDSNYLQTQNQQVINSGQQYTAIMNTVQLSSIPTRVYVWISETDNSFNWTKTDTYYGINSVNITFENRDSLLANASQYDLYQMSVRNGCEMSWRQWTRDVGSVLCFSFASDVPLGPLQAPGLRGKFTFSMQVNATNLSPNASIPSLGVLVISEGVACIAEGQLFQSLGVLDEKDVLNTKQQPAHDYRPSSNVYGGGFWQDLGSWAKKFARSGINVAKSLAPAQYQPVVSELDKLAREAGFGGRGISRSALKQLMY